VRSTKLPPNESLPIPASLVCLGEEDPPEHECRHHGADKELPSSSGRHPRKKLEGAKDFVGRFDDAIYVLGSVRG
jgi:hypothetical protein